MTKKEKLFLEMSELRKTDAFFVDYNGQYGYYIACGNNGNDKDLADFFQIEVESLQKILLTHGGYFKKSKYLNYDLVYFKKYEKAKNALKYLEPYVIMAKLQGRIMAE